MFISHERAILLVKCDFSHNCARPFLKLFTLSYRTVVCPRLSVCDVSVLWTNVWMDQDETWHAGRQARPHCVRRRPNFPQKRHIPQFSAHVRCGQMDGWIKMPLGMEVGLGLGDFVLDGDPPRPKRGTQPPIFGPCLLWPNGWMD